MREKIQAADMSQVRRISISDRTNLVKVSDFARVPDPGSGFMGFLESLPSVKHRTNAAAILKTVIERISLYRSQNNPITWALGPHIIKYGLTPYIVHLMERKVIDCVLMNGAGAIHDVEIAMIGETSEEMGGHISTGVFGMAKETGEFIHSAAKDAALTGSGLGCALGKKIVDEKLPFLKHSLLAQAWLRQIPFTVHVGLGTDIIHMHPDMNGAHTGEASYTDFKIAVAVFQRFTSGGMHLNIGSSVILPEVFVKALTAANNLNQKPAQGYTTVNVDHLSEYRPLMNVVHRGSMDGGEGFEIIGRMEILLPLISCLITERFSGC